MKGKTMCCKSRRRTQWLVLTMALVLVGTGLTNVALAQETKLVLLRYRWEKTPVTYWIEVGRGVSVEATANVLTALDDWATSLQQVPGAPALEMAGNRKAADIVVKLEARTARFLGGPRPRLGGGVGTKTDGTRKAPGCKLVSETISIYGSELAGNPSDARVRNLTRRLTGEALGLGWVDCGELPCGTGDLMEGGWANTWEEMPPEDLPISACDLEGIWTIYNAPSCQDIPVFIPYTCN